MFAVGGLLAIIQAGGVLLMPPSPRFYVLRGKYSEVRADTSDGRFVSCYSTFYADLPAVLTVPDAAPVVKVENLRRGNSIFSLGPQP